MPWKFMMCSQSANNDSSKDMNMDDFMKIDKISLFLPQEIDFLFASHHFQIAKDDLSKVQEVAGSNPREIFLLLSQKEEKIDDKIAFYKIQRGEQIWQSHGDYLKTLSSRYEAFFIIKRCLFYG